MSARPDRTRADGLGERDSHGNHADVLIEPIREILHRPDVLALFGSEPDVHEVPVPGVACVPEDKCDLIEESGPVSDPHPPGRAGVPYAADTGRDRLFPVDSIALLAHDHRHFVSLPVLSSGGCHFVGIELVLILVPVRSADLDAGKIGPLPARCHRMPVWIERFQVRNGDCIPAVVGFLLVEKLPEIHVGPPPVDAVLDESFDFLHLLQIERLVVEDLLKSEDSVEDGEAVCAGALQQLVGHDALLDEKLVQIAIEQVGAVLLRETIHVESALREMPEVHVGILWIVGGPSHVHRPVGQLRSIGAIRAKRPFHAALVQSRAGGRAVAPAVLEADGEIRTPIVENEAERIRRMLTNKTGIRPASLNAREGTSAGRFLTLRVSKNKAVFPLADLRRRKSRLPQILLIELV